ncbi:Uncharacterised protein [Bacteroides ovatus]|uniref:hypothetical protein n=1 Tax=Bacteroides ovatus TaxID=28116 RepID=UPI000DA0A024|nr:Uncharacterised protein [Bacteroides ovatus]
MKLFAAINDIWTLLAGQPTYLQTVHFEHGRKDERYGFLRDIQNLIRPNEMFNPQEGYELIKEVLIERLKKDFLIHILYYIHLSIFDFVFWGRERQNNS